jgi:hypothetical protein
MSILHKLWHGKIIPYERAFRSNEKLEHIREQLHDEYTLLIGELSEAGILHFENYERLSAEIQSIFEEQIFIDAFRLASKLMIDVFNE